MQVVGRQTDPNLNLKEMAQAARSPGGPNSSSQGSVIEHLAASGPSHVRLWRRKFFSHTANVCHILLTCSENVCTRLVSFLFKAQVDFGIHIVILDIFCY